MGVLFWVACVCPVGHVLHIEPILTVFSCNMLAEAQESPPKGRVEHSGSLATSEQHLSLLQPPTSRWQPAGEIETPAACMECASSRLCRLAPRRRFCLLVTMRWTASLARVSMLAVQVHACTWPVTQGARRTTDDPHTASAPHMALPS